jgi:drug/metabolite transporter (DMT)-like permease
MVTGVLVHGVYLGGVFFAISRGMPAGVAALVVALQPLATAFAARLMLGEKLRPLQLAGLVAGLFGVALVIAPKLLGGVDVSGITPVTLASAFAAVAAISLGTVYQKRFVSGLDLRIATVAQYTGALLPFVLLSLFTETRQVEWTGEFIFAMGWLVLVLSIGAVGLLMLLIRTNTAAGTASLFYLVPAVTAVIAWFLFGEQLTPIQLLGMAVVMGAVALATRAPKKNVPGRAG